MKDFKPLEHYKLNDIQFNDDMTGMIMKFHVSVIDKMDQIIVDAVIKTAREEGITNLFILDKKFIIDALKEKMAREKEIPAMGDVVAEYTYAICEIFEELLDEHNIDIPDDDRQGSPNEGRIYGSTWGDLTDKIYELLEQFKEGVEQNA